ncbi:Uncharacterised protein [Actinobacillus ureae]|uniref:hypothetical protein n=1 Tax=Actinobacillus ureae TaxID=723 RepID=UPI000E1815B9|nr:hypothetical protein [Actinobacillus ureae]SUT85544.1 Uncharacterised protein [Actinobacillus ureae]SUU42998.1 Uncharacterised protein [Actinobacillus ureae]
MPNWVNTIIEYAIKEGRGKITKYFIGKLLSKAPVGQDNIWPSEEIRDVLEELQSENMCEGMYIGKKIVGELQLVYLGMGVNKKES